MTDDLTPPPPPPPSAFEPPAPPPPPPAAFGTPYVTDLPTAPVQKKGFGTRALAAGLGVVLLGGGLAFAVSQSGSSGASTPEEAVQQLFDAMSDEDIIGVLDALPDGERRSFQRPLEDLSSELQRLGVLSEGFDLSDVGGIDLQFDDLDLASETLGEGLSVVHVRGGSLTTAVDPDTLPLGDELRDLIEELNGEPLDIEPTSNIDSLDPESDAFDIVTVQEDGSWRVSLWYSVAEAARSAADLPMPDFGGGVTPNGQDSPEAAVEALLRAGVEDLDIEAMIALLPPDEMAALQDYAPLFLDDVAAEVDDFAADYSGSIESIELSADRDGDEALVTIDDIDVELAYDDGDTSTTFDGECLRFEDEYSDEEMCLDDYPIGAAGLEDMDLPLRDELPTTGIRAVEVDGRWYVSPTRTVLDAVVATLSAFEDDALDSIPDMIDGFFEGMFGGLECESFGFTGEDLGEIQSGEDGTDGDVDACAGFEETFEETGEVIDPEDGTSTTIVDESSATTVPGGVPSIEALTAMLVDLQGFTPEEADCIAGQIYAVGFTDEQLLELQGGPIPDEIGPVISQIVSSCVSFTDETTTTFGSASG